MDDPPAPRRSAPQRRMDRQKNPRYSHKSLPRHSRSRPRSRWFCHLSTRHPRERLGRTTNPRGSRAQPRSARPAREVVAVGKPRPPLAFSNSPEKAQKSVRILWRRQLIDKAMTDDSSLLRLYVERRSNDAFTALVSRHVDFVYSTALRRVGGDPVRAQDVAQ